MKKLTALVLVLSLLLSLLAVPMGALAEEFDDTCAEREILMTSSENEPTDEREWFELNGNSEFFTLYKSDAWTNRTARDDFIPGVDFGAGINAPTGDFATDCAAITANMGCFAYTVDANPSSVSRYTITDFAKDANEEIWWTINDVAYKLNVNANIIKLYPGVDTSAISTSETLSDEKKSELLDAYASLNEMTIDVEDKQYSELGLLAATTASSSSVTTRNLKVTLVYEDGS